MLINWAASCNSMFSLMNSISLVFFTMCYKKSRVSTINFEMHHDSLLLKTN